MKPVFTEVRDSPLLIDEKAGWQKEWVGMPEFVQNKQREYAKIIIRFRNQQDLDDFAALIGQKLNSRSQCTWYPELTIDKNITRKYVDES